MKIIPIVMVKNEEIWIERILTPLMKVFGQVVVADTGSTDSTTERIRRVEGVNFIRYPPLPMDMVGLLRQSMQAMAATLGATHVMLVDGDELYPTTYLQYIFENPMPESAPCGFTRGIECGELPSGEIIQYEVRKSRDAVFSVDSRWSGIYPFEGHTHFNLDPARNYHWPSLIPQHYFFHVHGCKRSSRDMDVEMRVRKQHQFCMQKEASDYLYIPWLESEKDYRDE